MKITINYLSTIHTFEAENNEISYIGPYTEAEGDTDTEQFINARCLLQDDSSLDEVRAALKDYLEIIVEVHENHYRT